MAQVLLKKAGGGRVAAREVLLNTAAGARVIADGQSPSCRAPSTAAASTAWCRSTTRSSRSCSSARSTCAKRSARRPSDGQPVLETLKRDGIDTSVVERLG